jgi:hypothetical protein
MDGRPFLAETGDVVSIPGGAARHLFCKRLTMRSVAGDSNADPP